MLMNLTLLPGDGIGPEVTEQAVLVLQAIANAFSHELRLQTKNIGGAALTATNYPIHLRPEAGLLCLRRELGAYANLRPAICFPALEDCGRRRGCPRRLAEL